jgi:phosphoesterase RecJ-like protein
MLPILQVLPHLAHGKEILITMHQKPDADALGSSLGLYHVLNALGHKVNVVSPTNWPSFLNWMPGMDAVIDAESRKDYAAELVQHADIIFCLDFNTLSRTKGLEAEIRSSAAIRVLIDHHQEPDVASFTYGVSDTAKSSTAEMVYDFIQDSGFGHLISNAVAQCIYAGVMTDTGSFRFPATTASVHRLVAALKDGGLQHHLIHDQVFDTFLENRLRFFGHVLLNRMDVNYELNTVLIAIPKADLIKFGIKTGDTEGLVNYPLSMQGIKMAAIVIDRDEERKWSFRSKGNVDVNTFARQYFDGGGHKNAAGGRSVESLEATVAKFHKVLPDLSAFLSDY